MVKHSGTETHKPPLRYHWLTPTYDWVVAHGMPERAFRSALITQARIAPGQRVLDFGCGTGSLAFAIEAAVGEAEIIGVDVDPAALAIAGAKAVAANSQVSFQEIAPGRLPFEDGSFDRVLTCLVFHHLNRTAKVAALSECRRVLRSGGEIHIADWGQPANRLLRVGFFLTQLLDGFDTTTDHARGLLPDFVRQAGFQEVAETGQFKTAFGSLRLLSGVAG